MIGDHVETILIVTGALTAIMLAQLVAPAQVLSLIFGEAPTDRVTRFLARHWGLLIFCVGILPKRWRSERASSARPCAPTRSRRR
jgi:hypothetical protein